MGNFLKFNDLVQFSLLDPNLIKVKDDYEGAFKPESGEQTHHTGMGTVPAQQQNAAPSQNGLNIKIAATHSGIITRNNGFYLPDKMKKGAETFIEDFGKPILLHHQEKEDSVGRVIASQYVDSSGAIADKYNGLVVRNRYGDEIGTIKDSMIKDFVSNKMPFGQQIDVVCTLLKDSILEDSDYQGLGHIQILANISEPTAIQKLLDGRYLTGSVGATTNKAVCSVCKSDWTKGGPCDHKPGGVYDDAKCFIIAGDLIYDEYSFVNVPADRHSKVLELHYNGITDSVEIANDYKGRIYEVQLQFPQYDSVNEEDKGMKNTAKKDGKTIQDSTNPAPDAEPTAEGTDKTEIQDDTQTSESNSEESTEVTEVQDDTESTETVETTSDDSVVEVKDSVDDMTTEDYEKLYDLMWNEVEAAFKDGAFTLEDLGVAELSDAKLSSEKRKSLPKSTFCGPGRSFPVTDCAHVVAARQLVEKVTISDAAKEKILVGVNRKAKRLGCDSTQTKDSVETPSETPQTQDGLHHARIMQIILAAFEESAWSPEDDPALSDEDKQSLTGILKRLASLVSKDHFVSAVVELELVDDPKCEEKLLDEIAKLEDETNSLRDSLEATRKEYSSLYQDLESLQDSLVDEKSKIRKVQEEQLTVLKTLHDAKVDEEVDWTSLTDEGIVTELDRLTKEVDMKQITGKLDDGMSRVPEGEIENPAETGDGPTPKSKVSLQDIARFQEQYMTILFRDGEIAAEHYKKQMIKEGKLPQSIEDIQGGSN